MILAVRPGMSPLVPYRFVLAGLLLAACRYEPIHGSQFVNSDARTERTPGTDVGTPSPDAPPVPLPDAAPGGDVLASPPEDGAAATDTSPLPMPMPMPMPDAARTPDTTPPPDMAPTPPPIVCGNGVVERGETCEPVAECNRRQAACQSDANTIRTASGSASACTFVCNQSPRACGPADGACPAGCARDPNCLPRPDDCTDIEWCVKPFQPNQGKVICRTAMDARCTDAERIAECAREAASVCGSGHARPIQYVPPIGGRPSG